MPGENPVKGIVFEGLSFSYADRQKWLPEDAGLQHDWNMWDKANGLIRFRGAEGCVVRNCTFSDGVRMDLYAQNNTVEQSTFRDLGGSAVLLAGYGPGKKDVNKNNSIHDNEITRVGQIYLYSPGIFICHTDHPVLQGYHFGVDKVGSGLDKNIYFHEKGGMEGVLKAQIKRNTTKQADLNSIAATPLFVDLQNGDFAFQEQSPARTLEIELLTRDLVAKMCTSRDPFLNRFQGNMPLVVHREVNDLKGKKGKKHKQVFELDL